MNIVTTLTSVLTNKKHWNLLEEVRDIEQATYEELKDLKDEIKVLLEQHNPRYIQVEVNGYKVISQGNLKMAFELKDTPQFTVLTATVLDAAGKPAHVEGVPFWTTSNADVATVAQGEGLTATVTSVGQGTATITFQVDGVTATFDVTVVGGAAATATLEASPAADVVPTAPAA